MNQTTITLTDEQIEIIGYALVVARRDQKAKLEQVADTHARFWQGLEVNETLTDRCDGYRERLARLEEVSYLLPNIEEATNEN